MTIVALLLAIVAAVFFGLSAQSSDGTGTRNGHVLWHLPAGLLCLTLALIAQFTDLGFHVRF